MRNIVDGMPQNFSPGENGQLDSAWVKEFVLREVQKNVTAALDKYSADQTGKADFALESGGWGDLWSFKLFCCPLAGQSVCQSVLLFMFLNAF